MKKSIVKTTTSIRFRKWSRKNYAAFSGLNKIISIGHVSATICEKALLKNNLLSVISGSFVENCDTARKYEEQETDLSQLEILLNTNALPVTTDYPVGCSVQYLLTQGWNRAIISVSTFLF